MTEIMEILESYYQEIEEKKKLRTHYVGKRKQHMPFEIMTGKERLEYMAPSKVYCYTINKKGEKEEKKMDLKGYTKGERVKLLREAVGMSQKELAEMIGTSSPAISMIETGKNWMNNGNAQKMAEALGVHVEVLQFGEILTGKKVESEAEDSYAELERQEDSDATSYGKYLEGVLEKYKPLLRDDKESILFKMTNMYLELMLLNGYQRNRIKDLFKGEMQ